MGPLHQYALRKFSIYLAICALLLLVLVHICIVTNIDLFHLLSYLYLLTRACLRPRLNCLQ